MIHLFCWFSKLESFEHPLTTQNTTLKKFRKLCNCVTFCKLRKTAASRGCTQTGGALWSRVSYLGCYYYTHTIYILEILKVLGNAAKYFRIIPAIRHSERTKKNVNQITISHRRNVQLRRAKVKLIF